MAPSSHSISCSSGLGDLGAGSLVRQALFIYFFSIFPLCRQGRPSHPTARPQVPAALGGGSLCNWCLVFSRLLLFILPQGPGGFSHSSGQPGSGGAGKTQGAGRKASDQHRCLLPLQRTIFYKQPCLWQGSGVQLLPETFLGAHGHRAKACCLEEMFNKDMRASNCLSLQTGGDVMSLETASKIDHEVGRLEGETTGGNHRERLAWPRPSPLLLPPASPACAFLGSHTL